MSQVDALQRLFDENCGRLSLGEILSHWNEIGSKYTNRISELRERLELTEGKTILCAKGRRPSENIYRIVKLEENGQGLLRMAV